MSRAFSVFFCVAVTCFALLFTGCRGRQTASATDYADVPVDTTFADVVDFSSVDTSSEAVFRTASLSEELERMVREALQPVYFDYDRFTLTQQGIDRLGVVAAFLKENTSMRVLIEGHCDERGSSSYNMGLGENRAKSVRDYLVNMGIKPIRLEVTSYGMELPSKSGCTVEEGCHSLNRRAEFKVLGR